MTRKTSDNIGHFGRSFFARKQENKGYSFDLENMPSPNYDSSLLNFKDNFLLHRSNDSYLEVRENLASAYQILAMLNLDDHTYTHLSSRPKNEDFYYIYPFGLCFEEVTKDNLLKVSLDGEILEGNESQYNKTGYVIHGSIFKARSDITTIFHLHTTATVAVSCLKEGLIPIMGTSFL